METVLKDCFWCGEAYELGLHERCPKCSTDINNIQSSAPGSNIQTTYEI